MAIQCMNMVSIPLSLALFDLVDRITIVKHVEISSEMSEEYKKSGCNVNWCEFFIHLLGFVVRFTCLINVCCF